MKRSETDIAGPVADERSSKRRRKKEALKEFRRALLARAKVPGGWKCERCGKVFSRETLIHAHHRLARSQGGSNCIGNGAAICWLCHQDIHLKLGNWQDWLVVRNTLGKTA